MNNKIFLFSDSIQSGKTSAVLGWVKNRKNVSGILTPDIDGVRMLYDVKYHTYHPFETNVNELREVEVIGRFVFLKSAFKKAIAIFYEALRRKTEWLIIDEIGKLELADKGLEPALSLVLENFSANSPETKIIIIVRDYLLDATIKKYGFKDAEIVNVGFFRENKYP
ncbi:hypothetical protein I5M32_01250 [Pedobacter sp. SD-b]|uniref:NTPase n=1 Tax=Pedobacter segetis TaxID=2793069 RepID=A0ABS1BFC9_9SPHI|nr:nucleoside-triphosphatase [Pedobacter segetis]MBK0381573.1 hypothetical protein [Pedobacter segetis]